MSIASQLWSQLTSSHVDEFGTLTKQFMHFSKGKPVSLVCDWFEDRGFEVKNFQVKGRK